MNAATECDAGLASASSDAVPGLPSDEVRRVAVEIGLNSLVGAAHPLLQMAASLRRARAALPLEMLRKRLCEMVEAFVDEGERKGIDADTLAVARYCLCTFVDETIAATPWGGGAWGSRSLLVIFHGEASGGERFFTILHRLSQEPAAHLDALELLYVILSLGMAGRYRLIKSGSAELERVREKLRGLIRTQRSVAEAALSPHWQAVTARPRAWWQARGVAFTLTGAVLSLALLFAGLDYDLRLRAQPAMRALAAVRLSAPPASPDAPPPAAPSTLAALLAPEIAEHLVSVDEAADRTVITLNTDGIFASGSARVLPADVPLIRRIGGALSDMPGRVIVVGHTDDQRDARRGTSNWQLSLARASQVVDLLREEAGHPERFLAQGRGDTEPVAPNDSPANRARNRRVVITLLKPGASL